MPKNTFRVFAKFPELRGVSPGYGQLLYRIVFLEAHHSMKDPLERLRADNIMQHPNLHADLSDGDPGSSKNSSRLACNSAHGFSEIHTAASGSLESSTLHNWRGPNNVLNNITNTKLRDYILKRPTDHEVPKTTTQLYPSQDTTGIPTATDVGRVKVQQSVSREDNILHRPGTLPIGTTRPVAFNTYLLGPATHKLVGGSINILPSLSVLVDFRESQRRNGFKGDYVLLIDSTGNTVG